VSSFKYLAVEICLFVRKTRVLEVVIPWNVRSKYKGNTVKNNCHISFFERLISFFDLLMFVLFASQIQIAVLWVSVATIVFYLTDTLGFTPLLSLLFLCTKWCLCSMYVFLNLELSERTCLILPASVNSSVGRWWHLPCSLELVSGGLLPCSAGQPASKSVFRDFSGEE
jgi:hypothetical protein